MSINDLEISKKWPAKNPDILQLYTFPTPNGVKISIMLEELELTYEAHKVMLNETTTPEFLSLNPNNKIPAIIDPDGPDNDKPFALWESGAILIYLAEKHGQFLSSDPVERLKTLQWLMFQMGGVGPMFGQYNFFNLFGGKDIEDKRPKERYENETKRLLSVLEGQLSQGHDYIAGANYSIADISLIGWLNFLKSYQDVGEQIGFESYSAVNQWLDKCLERPGVQKGLAVLS